MAEPTDEQLREYAAKLPDLYREIFEAFYLAHPKRRMGDGLGFDSLVSQVAGFSESYRDEIAEGLDILIERGFLERQETRAFPLVAPTALGERLMAEVTGKQPQKRGAPPLPELTWG